MQAKGKFEVIITPVESTALAKEAGIGSMSIDKKWCGDLTGSSKGVMITGNTESTGLMTYVALEKVEGQLGGKSGSFYFSHRATMIKGDVATGVLKIEVVSGSGTDEIAGLEGELTIDIDKGTHSYVFNYNLP